MTFKFLCHVTEFIKKLHEKPVYFSLDNKLKNHKFDSNNFEYYKTLSNISTKFYKNNSDFIGFIVKDLIFLIF